MKIVCISGKAEHGKDLTATIIKEKLESKGSKVLIIRYADLLKYIAKQYFGWDGNKDEKGRTLLQYLGTEIVRTRKPEYWVNFVKEFIKLFEDEWEYILIPDSRFPNEMDCWKIDGWDITALRVIRLGYENHLTPEQRQHPSEIALDDYNFDYYLKSEDGIGNLSKEVDKFLKYLEVR